MTKLADKTPRQVEAYLRQIVLRTFGNDIEDHAQIWAATGFYNIVIERPKDYTISFLNLRRESLPKIVKALKELGIKTKRPRRIPPM